MRIIIYANGACPHGKKIQAVMKKYHLSYEEYDDVNSLNANDKMGQYYGQQSLTNVEIDGAILKNVRAKDLENYLLEKVLVKLDASGSEKTSFADEEREAIHSKTTRFF